MADKHSKEVRSFNMSQVKAKNTKPEILVRKFLFSHGLRFRIHVKKLPGKPDIVLPKYNTVVFVNGCFWHGHENCKKAKLPETRKEWWSNKIITNIRNDEDAALKLRAEGWEIITIWTCKLHKHSLEPTLLNVVDQIKSNRRI